MEGGGRARRRRKRKGRGGGSAGEPHGRSEAEGDTARGEEGIGGAVQVTPRDGVECNAGGGGGPGGRREGHNGEAERERLRLGGLGSRRGMRNGGIEQERFGLGGLGVQPLQLAGGSGGCRGRRRRGGSAAGEPHDTLGAKDEMAGDAAGDEQAMGRRYGDAAGEGGAELIRGARRNSEPTPPLAEDRDSAVAMEGGRKARAAVEVHLSSRTGGATPRVTRPAATEEANVYRQRRATAWNPMLEVVEDLAVAGKGTTARPSGKGSALEVPGKGATVALSRKGSALDEHGAGGYDGWQGSGGAAAGDPHGMLGAGDEMAGEDGGGLGGRMAGHNSNTENKKLGLGGLGAQQVHLSDEQATGSSQSGVSVQLSGGGRRGCAVATSAEDLSGERQQVQHAEEHALLPRRNFLCDALLSWTINDVLNVNFFKDKVQKNPDAFDTVECFAEVHHQILLEELRSVLCSSINNPIVTQYCKIVSVQPCGSANVYYLDINLDASDPNNIRCRHIARDYDICLLTSKPLGDSNLDIMSSSLGITLGVGLDTFFQKSFKVLPPQSKDFQPQNTKYVSFLTNIQYNMEIANILSLDDERNQVAVQSVINLHKQIGKSCNICSTSLKCNDQGLEYIFSNTRCLHPAQGHIVWAPPGSMKGCFPKLIKSILDCKQKMLVCVPSALGIPHLLTDLEEFSHNVVVLNNRRDIENYTVCNDVFLEDRSHKLYCFVTQYYGSLKGMFSLLDLTKFYHYNRCTSLLCARCTKDGKLNFSMRSISKRFNNLIGYLLDSLNFLKKHSASFSLFEEDNNRVGDLSGNLKEFQSLLRNKNLKDHYVAAAFELMPGVDISSLDSTYNLAKSLNKRRITSVNLMGSLINSVQVPNMKNRDDLDRFCIQHSNITVTTIDCIPKLHDIKIEQFDILLILGSNQLKEVDLVVPFLHPVQHTILIGDPYHLQPVVQSELCKEAGFGVSIFDKMRRSVPKKVSMLKRQFAIHPEISKFPNSRFYNGVIDDGPNVMLSEYNKEFSKKLPIYQFMDIPFGEMRTTRKIYVNSAAIFLCLQSFCKGTTHSNKKFNVAVVCISSDEANTFRDLLRSKEKIYAKVHLHVKSVDSFQEEPFDLIILSMLIEDKTELSRVKENNLYAVLTSARHYFWMVGECNTLIGAGGIWKSLVIDATRRERNRTMEIDKLSEIAKEFEKIDKDHCTNSVLPNKFTDLLGQELTWNERPYKTKYMLPPVRDQKGQPDTCTFHSISGAVESLLKFLYADLVPPQDFKWTFIVDDFKHQYETIINRDFQSEDASDRGNKRFENAFRAFENLGVMAKDESGNEFRQFKISCHDSVDPKKTEAVTKLLEAGSIMVGHFLLSRNFYSLKPGEVYVHDKDRQIFHPKSGQPASHAVTMIGIGRRQTRLDEKTGEPRYTRHMVIQNSEGNLFGFNGIGRVGKKTVLDLYRIEVSDPEAKKPACHGA